MDGNDVNEDVPDIEEHFSQNDRQWFANHPKRVFRRRRKFAGEFVARSKSTHVIVIQVRPGIRILRPLLLVGRPPKNCDKELARLHRLILDRETAFILDRQVYSVYELARAYPV